MAIERLSYPYELLFRWKEDGTLSGAHVIFREEFRDGDVVLTTRLSDAMPLADAKAAGFPLEEAEAALSAAISAG